MKRARCQWCGIPLTAADHARAKRGGRTATACDLPNHAQQARRRRGRLAKSGLSGEALNAAIEREARATGKRLAEKAQAVPAARGDAEYSEAPENAASEAVGPKDDALDAALAAIARIANPE